MRFYKHFSQRDIMYAIFILGGDQERNPMRFTKRSVEAVESTDARKVLSYDDYSALRGDFESLDGGASHLEELHPSAPRLDEAFGFRALAMGMRGGSSTGILRGLIIWRVIDPRTAFFDLPAHSKFPSNTFVTSPPAWGLP